MRAVAPVWRGSAFTVLLVAFLPPYLTAAERLNIVLIMADDFGYELVGANGSRSYKTPHLDKLAATGMRFEHCYAQPLCTPTRIQLMTGMSNKRNYLRFGTMPPNQVTFANHFRKAGYATCIAGKWQLEGGYEGPRNLGFDEYCLWQLNRRPSRYANPGLEINGKQVDYTKGEYGPDLVSDYLCDFMTRHRDKSFLAYYPMMLTHAPYEPTPDSKDWNPTQSGRRSEEGQKKHFPAMVAYCDKLVGKIVSRVEGLGLRDKTLIIFTGDNGTGKGVVSRLGESEVIGGKGTTTRAGTRVPLIVNCPGHVRAGAVSNDLVDSTDFFPTMLAAAGIQLPNNLTLDGRSFLPQLRGEPGNPRSWIYAWYNRAGGPTGTEWVHNQRYKLYGDGRFYDLAQDAEEKHPLPAEKQVQDARDARKSFEGVLDRYQKVKRSQEETPPRARPKKKAP